MPSTIFLSIVIPTFNRSDQLHKNLNLVTPILYENKFKDEFELIISDNSSEDNTREMLNSFNFKTLNYSLYFQKQNMGPIYNCLFLLEKAKGKFIMYLGDDDYLDKKYLDRILPFLKMNESIYCVIPSTMSLYPSGEIKPGRDYNKKSKIYNKGFNNCLENSWRGTQLSAIIHYRKDLYSEFIKQSVNNLYPFIFFVAFNCLRGSTWHMTEYPVTITQMEASVNVNYGDANLIPDIFDNYKKLPNISYFQRSRLEIKVLKEQPWRFLEYLKKEGIKGLSNFIFAVFKNESTSLVTKIALSPIILKELINRIFKESRKRILHFYYNKHI
jgi:glycosyltransferase involved in cell wall biosynthesis